MSIRNILFFLAATLFCSCQSTAQQSKAQESTNEATATVKTSTPAVGSPIAHLKAPMEEANYPYDITLRKADGTDVNSAEVLLYEDGPTIISFWLTTCGPCLMEFAAMKKKYAHWNKEMDFNFVAISTDFPKNYDKFARMVNDNDWPWESYNDVNREFWKVIPGALNGLPQVFVYNQQGEVVYYKRKYSPGDEDTLFAKIKELQ